MPDNITEWLAKEARAKISRNKVRRAERVVDEINDGVIVAEECETQILEEGIITSEITQSTIGNCGHIIIKENIARCSQGHLSCKACITLCSGEHCGRLLCPQERHMLDGVAYCETCYRYTKAKRFFPWL